MSDVPQLHLTCGATDCDNELHCFNRAVGTTRRRRDKPYTAPGVCGACGTDPGIAWPRIHARNLNDADYTLEALKQEYIRKHFWTRAFTPRVMDYAKRKGRQQLYADIPKAVAQAVGKAQHPVEGRQVPVDDERLRSPIQYAQHSVAACCRRCVEKWHNIERGRPLTDEEIAYLSGLVRRYLDTRLPTLPDGPTHVPRGRRG